MKNSLQQFLNEPVPDYAGLSGVVFHGRSEGLVVNTNNGFGTVDASGNVTTWKSVSPHATGNDFNSNATAPTLSGGNIVLGGAGNFRHSGLSSVFNFMHYNATLANLKWCAHGIIKMGTTSNPGGTYGILGNAGGTTTNKGMVIYYDDSGLLNNKMALQIYRGVSNSFIENSYLDNLFTAGEFIDFWFEVDMSLGQEDQIKAFFNGVRFYTANYFNSTTPVTTPTFAMEIGAFGNGVLKGIFTIKELTIQSSLNDANFRTRFIASRMYKYGLIPKASYAESMRLLEERILLDTFDETRYYLNTHLSQNPSNSNIIVQTFQDTVNHYYEAAAKISVRKSTDKGLTWGSKTTAFDPTGADSAREHCAGYGTGDRLHIIDITITSLLVGSTRKLWYLYSDDDGGTWSTPLDITSILPADGLAASRTYSTIIENAGRLMCVIYSVTSEVASTNSALYLIYSDDNGANWNYKTIRASAASPYLNESAIVALSSTSVLVISRNDTTKEWSHIISSNNGDTWGAPGDITFGESLVTAGPVRLKKFLLNGTSVVACYFLDRDRLLTKVCYAVTANVIASGISGWNVKTKVILYQGTAGRYLHYGDVCHYDNSLLTVASYPLEYPANDVDNELLTMKFSSAHYYLVKLELGL